MVFIVYPRCLSPCNCGEVASLSPQKREGSSPEGPEPGTEGGASLPGRSYLRSGWSMRPPVLATNAVGFRMSVPSWAVLVPVQSESRQGDPVIAP